MSQHAYDAVQTALAKLRAATLPEKLVAQATVVVLNARIIELSMFDGRQQSCFSAVPTDDIVELKKILIEMGVDVTN